ncbi:MAG: DUF4349 domain-containing protein [Nanobdellota archaeon]
MTFKKQFKLIKENWLVLVILLLLMFFFTASGNIVSLFSGSAMNAMDSYGSEMSKSTSYYRGSSNFAPEEEKRKVTTNSRISIETKRGEFYSTEDKMKSIIKSSDSYLLDENENTNGEGLGEYHTGRYTIKVNSKKYDDVVLQLQKLGKVESFYESKTDITGSYYDTKNELESEKERLRRLELLYNSSKTETSDKIELTDKMFDVEKRIKYLEERLEGKSEKVEYSTIHLSLNEKRSGFANASVVKISSILKTMLNSFNTLLVVFAALVPWAILIYFVRLILKISKK